MERKPKQRLTPKGPEPVLAKHADALNRYLAHIGQFPILTREQEQELGRRARLGDVDARNELIEANLRFVIGVAKKYAEARKSLAPHASFLDLIQEGNKGLLDAARGYDERLGSKFLTYAGKWIEGAIRRFLYGSKPTVRAGEIRGIYRKLQSEEKVREIEPEEVATAIGCTAEEVEAALGLKDKGESLEELTGREVMNGEGERSAAVVRKDASWALGTGTDDEQVLKGEKAEFLRDVGRPGKFVSSTERTAFRALARWDLARAMEKYLAPRQGKILRLYFGLDADGKPHTLEEIGGIFKLSRARVQQLKKAALDRLRKSPLSDRLLSYLRTDMEPLNRKPQ